MSAGARRGADAAEQGAMQVAEKRRSRGGAVVGLVTLLLVLVVVALQWLQQPAAPLPLIM